VPQRRTPRHLPTCREILAELAAALGLEGADHGHALRDVQPEG
jgi:hypothetical protein